MEGNTSVESDIVPPDRSSSSSAPPALQLASESLFAFTVEYAKIFSDIRAHEDYIQYYESNKEKKPTLPVPLDPNPFLWQEEDQRLYRSGERGTAESIADAQESFQQLNLSRGKAVDIPTLSTTSGIWNPVPRAPKKGLSLSNGLTREDSKELLSKFNDISYSSSPSAQTALNTAQFIWKDEESNFAPPTTTHQQPQQQQPPQPLPQHLNFQSNHHNTFASERTIQEIPSDGTKADTYSSGGAVHMEDSNSSSPTSPPPREDSQSPNATSPRSNVICRYFQSGYCSRGDKCFYSHDVEPVPEQKPEPKTKAGKAAKSNAGRGKNDTISTKATNGHLDTNASAVTPVSPRGQETYTAFEPLIGKIYTVSKDQQGCRFLQKKLEEQDPVTVETIFKEVYDYINELMTDPFGNYLCQKLLEHCNDQQRFLIVQKVAPDLVYVSKNMHGTRAVQTMIQCLSSPPQIDLVKRALGGSVVELIQDLNGNHVIQRCLNRLSPEDNQFIYDSVTTGNNCVAVATHRHGCCVLQRCIDHASKKQKVQLIQEITKNALVLVQDPYGNYVVQYVLELPFPDLVDSLTRAFLGNIRLLATQKFSSNVVEKCLHVTSAEVKYLVIKEIVAERAYFSQLLQDPFANYVIQTALSVSDTQQHYELVEAIKPFLAQLRNTPFGKRIQSRITKEAGERERERSKR